MMKGLAVVCLIIVSASGMFSSSSIVRLAIKYDQLHDDTVSTIENVRYLPGYLLDTSSLQIP